MLNDLDKCLHRGVDCRWSDWTEMNCSKSCGGGKKRREREQSFQLRGVPALFMLIHDIRFNIVRYILYCIIDYVPL